MTNQEARIIIECELTNMVGEYADREMPETIKRIYDALTVAENALERCQKAEETFEWCPECKEYDQEKHCCHRFTKQIRKTVSDIEDHCRKLCEKDNKYKWHDLRKNPEDLPSHNKKVIVYYRKRNSENTLQYGTDRIIGDYPKGWRGFQKGNRVIAWKEIKEFEVKE